MSFLADLPALPSEVTVYEEANILCIQVRDSASEATIQRGVNFLLALLDQKQNSVPQKTD